MPKDGSSLLDRIGFKALERLLAVGTAVVIVAGACIYALGRPPQNRLDALASLNPDGSAELQMRLSSVWNGPIPLQETSFSRSVAFTDDRWTDGAGRPLEVRTEPRQDGGSIMHVRYAAPLFPGERMEVKNTFKAGAGAVQREGADYLFVEKMGLGGDPTAVSYSLMLPEGAKVISTAPDAKWRCEVNGRSVLNFKWTEKTGMHPELRVKYSLPNG